MEFCPECENMLWLKIITDSDEQKSAYLKKYCKNCNYTTSKIENNRIYENTYNFKDASYKSKVNKYLSSIIFMYVSIIESISVILIPLSSI